MEQTNFKRFKKIYKNYLVVFIVYLFLFGGIFSINCNGKNPVTKQVYQEVRQNTDTQENKLKNNIILEVSKYVKSKAKNANQFIPKYIVNAALEHNIDICFMMAQTQIETNFGTTGIGRESSRRSMFGVMGHRYGSYEDAINSYCKLLKRSYLVRGRTEKHLMAKYVTGTGARYACNPKYEQELTKAYNIIKRSTNIYKLQQEYKNKF